MIFNPRQPLTFRRAAPRPGSRQRIVDAVDAAFILAVLIGCVIVVLIVLARIVSALAAGALAA
jgi:hypothetical protein